MKNRKLTAGLLALLAVGSVLASCGSEAASGAENVPVSDPAEKISGEAEQTEDDGDEFSDRSKVKDGLGEYDFGGEDFIICYTSEQMEEPYFSDGEDGTVVNDAVFARTQAVEERFHIRLGNRDTGGNWNEVAEAVRTSTAAGASAYDLALTHTFIGLTGLISGGYLVDWNTVPAVDLKAQWWNQNISETLTVGGKLFVEANDYIYQRPMVIYFNKNMISDYDLDNPYDLVKGGTWTWDKLKEMAEAVSADANGDGKYDKSDRYGFSMTLGWQTISVIHSQGMTITSIGEDGTYNFSNYENAKMYDIFDRFYDLLYNSKNCFYEVVYTPDQGAVNGYTELFPNNQLLFLYSNTELLPRLREITLDFGILPLPKYDAAQDGYYSMADIQNLIVPSDCPDLSMTGVIAEALAVESYKKVVPAVYNTMFANKYLRDSESYEMFNLIRQGLVYEALWTWGEGSDLVYALPNLMAQKSSDLSSYYEKRRKSTEKTINKFVEKVLELES